MSAWMRFWEPLRTQVPQDPHAILLFDGVDGDAERAVLANRHLEHAKCCRRLLANRKPSGSGSTCAIERPIAAVASVGAASAEGAKRAIMPKAVLEVGVELIVKDPQYDREIAALAPGGKRDLNIDQIVWGCRDHAVCLMDTGLA